MKPLSPRKGNDMRNTDQRFKIISAHFFFEKHDRDGRFMLSFIDPDGMIHHHCSLLSDVLPQGAHKTIESLRMLAQLEFEGQIPDRVSEG